MFLVVQCGRGCCKISATDHWQHVRLILLLLLVCAFTATCWLVVVQGVLMLIDNSCHAKPAAPCEAAQRIFLQHILLATELSMTINESEKAY